MIAQLQRRRKVRRRWIARGTEWLTDRRNRLPRRVRGLVSRELLIFALLGGLTFLVDLALLTLLVRFTSLWLPVSVTVAYLIAFGLNYLLNRTLTFRSHAPVGPQVLRFVLVIACDYGITVGVTTGLSAVGMDFRLARIVAGACVAVFTFSACRWWVFRDVLPERSGSAKPHPQPAEGTTQEEVPPAG